MSVLRMNNLLFIFLIILVINTIVSRAAIISGDPDNPPHVTLYVKARANSKILNVNIDVKDDRKVEKIEFFVNNTLFLQIEDLGSKFYVKYKHRITDSFRENLLPIQSGTATDGKITIRKDTTTLGYKLIISGYYLILPVGKYNLKSVTYDNFNQKSSSSASVTIKKDNYPTVKITYPKNGAILWTTSDSANIIIKATASDDRGISKVKFYDYAKLIGVDASPPYQISASLSVGVHRISAIACDIANQCKQSSVAVTVKKDKPPYVRITSPKNGQILWTKSGKVSLTIEATASDDRSVKEIKFYVDGKYKGKDIKPPYNLRTTLNTGKHTIKATAVDSAEQQASAQVTIIVKKDNPPSVSITSPKDGSVFWTTSNKYTLTIKAKASDDRKISKVKFYINGNLIKTDTSTPYEVKTTLGIGKHKIEARAIDTSGQMSSSIVSIEVKKDNPPFVKITSPSNKATFWTTGLSYTVRAKATASDDRSISEVEFYVDGKYNGKDTKPPYEWSTTLGLGPHTLKVTAVDSAGQQKSDQITVIVRKDNPPSVKIISPKDGVILWTTKPSYTVKIIATATDDRSVGKVAFYVDGKLVVTDTTPPYEATTTLSIGKHSITATAYDNVGQKKSSTITVTVKKDNPPSVTITYPKNGAVFWTKSNKYTLTIKATARDDRGVKQVEFYVDGKKIYTDAKPPYEAKTTLKVGNHRIEARATDTSGQKKSSIVSIVVRKDNPPNVRITSPANGQVFWTKSDRYAITIKTMARDDRGIQRVEFYVDGKRISIDHKAPYQTTTKLKPGKHTLKAVAVDNAGQSSQDSVTITVREIIPPNIRKITVPEINWSSLLPSGEVVIIGRR